MARAQRAHYPGAVYHEITQGNNKEPILAVPAGQKDIWT
ncbi:hypothetical protein N752_04195 [Desulforamulus aquiferis]|nr:hypothetical protein N752_04195 [Desulforamulus aquiferis]